MCSSTTGWSTKAGRASLASGAGLRAPDHDGHGSRLRRRHGRRRASEGLLLLSPCGRRRLMGSGCARRAQDAQPAGGPGPPSVGPSHECDIAKKEHFALSAYMCACLEVQALLAQTSARRPAQLRRLDVQLFDFPPSPPGRRRGPAPTGRRMRNPPAARDPRPSGLRTNAISPKRSILLIRRRCVLVVSGFRGF